MLLTNDRKMELVIISVALCVIVIYVITLLTTTSGRPVSPLDDAYIHFQYARQIFLGEPWRYNSGEPISTGATSFLYPFMLAIGYLMGFHADRIVWVALTIGSLSLMGSALLIYHITLSLLKSLTRRDARHEQLTAVSAALLFLLNGALQWAYLNGMETGIFTFFVLLAFFVAINQRYWLMVLFLTSASLLRPEGLFLTCVTWIVLVVWQFFYNRKQLGRTIGILSVAVLLSAIPYFVNLAMTGTPVATGAQAKSWLGNVPFHLPDIIGSIVLMAKHITLRLSAGMIAPKPWPVVPLMLPLALIGVVKIWRQGNRIAVLLFIGWISVGIAATATLITALWHVGRYQVPYLALIVPFAAIGIFGLLRNIDTNLKRLITAVTLIALITLALLSTYQAQQSYHIALEGTLVKQIAMGDWIKENLPQDARIGVHDAGVVRYVGERLIYDLVGLTTQGAATAWRHGSGAQFEMMERLDQRPNYFATYPDVSAIPYFAETDLFAEQLFATELYLRSTAGTAGPVQIVYKADWQLANSGNRPWQPDLINLTAGMPLVTSIDVADLVDESDKGLTITPGILLPGFPTEVRQLPYRAESKTQVIDGGRMITGKVTFPVQVQPGQPFVLATRLHPIEQGAVRVFIDGQDAGLWKYPAAPGEWIETAFLIPADLVHQSHPTIELQVEEGETLEQPYPLYYIWAWQGEPVSSVNMSQTVASFVFGDEIILLDYDLDLTDVLAENTIELTLYWQTNSHQSVDAKMFLHVYDEDGSLVAQVDQRSYHDTQPPYAWIPGITIVDPISFVLPQNIDAGNYSLAIGLYEPSSGERYPVSGNPAQLLPENRVLLGEFTLP